MNLVLVHDWLNQVGGAEDVLEHLVRLYPDRPLYTSIYARDPMPAVCLSAVHGYALVNALEFFNKVMPSDTAHDGRVSLLCMSDQFGSSNLCWVAIR